MSSASKVLGRRSQEFPSLHEITSPESVPVAVLPPQLPLPYHPPLPHCNVEPVTVPEQLLSQDAENCTLQSSWVICPPLQCGWSSYVPAKSAHDCAAAPLTACTRAAHQPRRGAHSGTRLPLASTSVESTAHGALRCALLSPVLAHGAVSFPETREVGGGADREAPTPGPRLRHAPCPAGPA